MRGLKVSALPMKTFFHIRHAVWCSCFACWTKSIYCLLHMPHTATDLSNQCSGVKVSTVLFLWLRNWLIQNNSCIKFLLILNINVFPTCHPKSTIWIWAVSTMLPDVHKLNIKSAFSKICVGFFFPLWRSRMDLPFPSFMLGAMI